MNELVGGGLIVEPDMLDKHVALGTPDNFTVPEYIDSKPYCIAASNQGAESSCAGFTTAGYIEVGEWIKTHVQKQVDGSAIYAKAKTLDGMVGTRGTSLSAAVKAAQEMGLIDSSLSIRVVKTKRDVQFALHQHRVCIAGFMITEAWRSPNKDTGMIADGSGNKLGGHAVLVCYYDENSVGLQNSWGEWGVRGFGRMSWAEFGREFLYAVVLE